MRKFLVGALALALTVVPLLGGCGQKPAGGTTAVAQKVIRINNSMDPRTIDPASETSAYEFSIENQLFEGLTRQGPKGIEPGIATDWKVSDDGLTYEFHLRDAKFSNGDPITAQDFVYSWKRVLDPRFGSEYSYQLYYIKGAEAVNNIDVADANAATKIQDGLDKLGLVAKDPKTLVITLEYKTPYFLSLTAFPTYSPVDEKVVSQNPDWATKPETYISDGPFKLTEWSHGDKIVVEKNPNYWDAKTVKVDKIEFYMVESGSTELTMWETGQLDITFGNLPTAELARLKSEGKLQVQPLIGTMYFAPQNKKPPLDNEKVREALSMALDRKALTDDVIKTGSIPAYAFVPPGIPDADPSKDFRAVGGDLFKEDVQAAKTLLAEAGYPDGKGFPGFEIVYTTNETTKAIVEASIEMWKNNLGITNITARNVESKVRLEKRKTGDFQFTYTGWYGDYLDPMTYIDLPVTGGGQNEMKFSDPQYDSLVKEAKETGDPSKRMQLMHQAEQILFDKMGIIPIDFEVKVYLQSPKVTGVFRNALNLIDFKWADVDTSK